MAPTQDGLGQRRLPRLAGAGIALAIAVACSAAHDSGSADNSFCLPDALDSSKQHVHVVLDAGTADVIFTPEGYRAEFVVGAVRESLELKHDSNSAHVVSTHSEAGVTHTAIVNAQVGVQGVTGTVDGVQVKPVVGPTKSTDPELTSGELPILTDIAGARETLWRAVQDQRALCTDTPRSEGSKITSTVPTVENTIAGGKCSNCKSGCVSAFAGCLVGSVIGCAGFPWPANAFCTLVAAFACLFIEVNCHSNCGDANTPGSDCCPISCGNGHCCSDGDTCADSKAGTCCASGTTVCTSNLCCDTGTENCLGSNVCCPKTQDSCGSGISQVCCSAGKLCADATKSLCCDKNVIACNGKCCNQGEACIRLTPAGPEQCGKCEADPDTLGSGPCADGVTCCNKAAGQPGTNCSRIQGPIFCCLPKTICETQSTACCKNNETCVRDDPTGVQLKGDCCPDGETCGANAELCCRRGVGGGPPPVCARSDTASGNGGNPTCCDTTKYALCNGVCCSLGFKPNCVAGKCAP